MIVNNLLSNFLLLVALVITCDVRIRVKDTKGVVPYALIAVALVIKLATQPWSAWGYNIWLVLFLVILIQNNFVVQKTVTSFREELGFWPFLLVILVGLVGFRILYAMVRLLLPLVAVVLVIFLIGNKKSSQR